ncbi:MAG: response regulator transcription factor [Chloroflexi bacterium]|nr:response regulator transcription factor [Chloroflexota bacterium]
MPKKLSNVSKSKILWVEGRWVSNATFLPTLLKKGFNIDTVSTGKEALARVARVEHDLVIVDAASMRTSGKRICQELRERVNGKPIMLISDPKRPLRKRDQVANVILTLPFTSRKLVNRIMPLLPGKAGRSVKAGGIHLDLENRQVRYQGKKTKLTPRLVRLLKMLIDHKGEVVEREELFKKVWRTDYTGDTRTLDVHISWLRQIIEKNPRKPNIIKTMRGVGYILDV